MLPALGRRFGEGCRSVCRGAAGLTGLIPRPTGWCHAESPPPSRPGDTGTGRGASHGGCYRVEATSSLPRCNADTRRVFCRPKGDGAIDLDQRACRRKEAIGNAGWSFYNRFHQPDWAQSSLPRGLRPLHVRASRRSWPDTLRLSPQRDAHWSLR